MVTQQFLTEQSVLVYASQLGVTVTQLNSSVKPVTGQTPGRLIRQEAVIEAKRLFTYTEMTAAEVGYKLVFNDPSYFSRFFQRETGASTMEFRRRLSENYQVMLIQKNNYPNISGFSGVACGHTEYFNLWNSLMQ